MRKGLVMQLEERSVIVMTRDGQFIRIPRRGRVCEIGEEIAFPRRSFRFPNRLYSLGAACTAAVLLVFVLISSFSMFSKPAVAAYITMDINPSIELGIDEDDIVIEAQGLNKEGQMLIDEADLIGLRLNEAANVVLERAAPILAEYGKEQEAGEIIITSMVIKLGYEDEEKRYINEVKETMMSHIQQYEQDQLKMNITVLSVPKELRETAKEIGISSGKLAVKMLAENEGIIIPDEKLKEQSLTEISKEVGGLGDIIRQHTDDSKQVLRSMIESHQADASKVDSSNVPAAKQEGGHNGSGSEKSKAASSVEKDARSNADKKKKDEEKKEHEKSKEEMREQQKQKQQEEKRQKELDKAKEQEAKSEAKQEKQEQKQEKEKQKQEEKQQKQQEREQKKQEKEQEKQEKEKQKQEEELKQQEKEQEKQQKQQEKEQKQQEKEQKQLEKEKQKQQKEEQKNQEKNDHSSQHASSEKEKAPEKGKSAGNEQHEYKDKDKHSEKEKKKDTGQDKEKNKHDSSRKHHREEPGK